MAEGIIAGGFRLGPKTARIVFEGTDYDGAEVVVRLSVPLGLALQFQDMTEVDMEDRSRLFDSFARIALVEWNLEEEDGEPVPCNAAGLASIPFDLANIVMTQWAEAIGNLPGPLGVISVNGGTSVEPIPPKANGSPSRRASRQPVS